MLRRIITAALALGFIATGVAVFFLQGNVQRPARYLRLGEALVTLEENVGSQEEKIAAALLALDDGTYEGLLRAARNAAIGSVPAAARTVELGLREAFAEGGAQRDARHILEELARLGPVEQRLQAQIGAFLEAIGGGASLVELRPARDQIVATAREAREIAGNCLALYLASWPKALDASVEQLSERQSRAVPLLVVCLALIGFAAVFFVRVTRADEAAHEVLGGAAAAARAGLAAAAAERDQLRQSERRASLELALLRLEQQSLTESIRSSVIVCDTTLVVRLVNSVARTRFLLDEASLGLPLATLPGLVALVHGLGGLGALQAIVSDGRRLEVEELELEAASAWLHVRVTPYVDEAGHVRGLIVIADDITQAIETRRRLMQTERLAAMGRLSAQVTHEIRNPLSAIALNTDLLADALDAFASAGAKPADVADAKAQLSAISREVERLTEVTDEYLRLSRLRPPAMHSEDLSQLLRELSEFFGEDLRHRGISLTLDLPEPGPRVFADAAQLRQALMNIFKNSMESMPTGGHMTTRLSIDKNAGSEQAVVEVVDNGSGIPEHILARIFDPFYTTKEGGTGLGLPITQQIVAEHGGEVRAESETGRGTRVRVLLPTLREAKGV